MAIAARLRLASPTLALPLTCGTGIVLGAWRSRLRTRGPRATQGQLSSATRRFPLLFFLFASLVLLRTSRVRVRLPLPAISLLPLLPAIYILHLLPAGESGADLDDAESYSDVAHLRKSFCLRELASGIG